MGGLGGTRAGLVGLGEVPGTPLFLLVLLGLLPGGWLPPFWVPFLGCWVGSTAIYAGAVGGFLDICLCL